MARRSARISGRSSATPQPIKRVSLSHDYLDNVPRTVPTKLTSLEEQDEMPGAFPDSPSLIAPAAKRQCTTPDHKTGIVPALEEMHPQATHQSTAKVNAEARWLGFQSIETSKAAQTISTPTKTPSAANGVSSPSFKFTFQREQSLELSPAAKALMQEKRAEAARIKEQMKSAVVSEGLTEATSRRIATPKSQRSRFSDVHHAQFQKMDSIAGHASAFRKDPLRLQASAAKSATQSPSSTLRRMPSKTSLSATPSKAGYMSGKRKADDQLTRADAVQRDRDDATAGKRVKTENGSVPSQVPSFAVAVTPTKSLLSKTATIKPATTKIPAPAIRTPVKANTTVPIAAAKSPASSLTTSVRSAKLPPSFTRSPIRPPQDLTARTVQSTKPLLACTPIRAGHDSNPFASATPVRPQTSNLMSRFQQLRGTPIKSILRTPQRLYSDDPAKIAAGTHLATPPQIRGRKIPATAPVNKRVDFSSSTKAREATKEASVSPFVFAPSKPVEQPETITYPSLEDVVQTTPLSAQKRRQSSGPQDFTFRVGTEIVFAPTTTPTKITTPRCVSAYTIRHVPAEPERPVPSTTFAAKQRKIRFENAQSAAQTSMSPTVTLGAKKRKFDFENSIAELDADKENFTIDDECRPVKRAKQSASPAVVARVYTELKKEVKTRPTTLGVKPKTAVGKLIVKPADRGVKKAGATISMARLNALAQPKKR